MRVLVLTNFYPPYERGGYEQNCRDVVEGLQARRHQVTVLTSRYGVGSTGLSVDGVHRALHNEVDLRPYRGTVGCLVGRRRRLQQNLAILSGIVHSIGPDVLFVWGMWNLPAALLTAAEAGLGHPMRVAYYISDYWPSLPDACSLHWQEPGRRWYTSAAKQLARRLMSRRPCGRTLGSGLQFRHAACVSQAVRDHLVDSGVPLQRAAVIHNGTPLDAFVVAGRARRCRPGRDGLSLLYAGRMTPEKGVSTAIEAVSGLRDSGVTLSLVGSGSQSYLHELHQLANSLAVSQVVQFGDWVDRDEMPALMARHDILLYPATWPEPLPLTPQQAMAAGLVVVGTDVGGMPEILENEVNGLTFPPGDAAALAHQVRRLASDAGLRSRLADAGYRTVVERFDIRRMLDEVETFLQGVVEDRE